MIFIFPHQAQALTIASVKFSLADIAGGLAGYHVDCISWTYFACCATIFEIVCYQEVISYIKCVVLASGTCKYSILDSYSEFFVLLKLDSNQTLLEPSSE